MEPQPVDLNNIAEQSSQNPTSVEVRLCKADRNVCLIKLEDASSTTKTCYTRAASTNSEGFSLRGGESVQGFPLRGGESVPKGNGETPVMVQLRSLVSSFPPGESFAAVEQLRGLVSGVPHNVNRTVTSSDHPGTDIQASLSNSEIWNNFKQYGTEMILTRGGRRMFPTVDVSLSGMKENVLYTLMLDMVQVSDQRYRFNFNTDKWQKSGGAFAFSSHPMYVHPESPALGAHWMNRPVSFKRLKLTNQARAFDAIEVQMSLNSMHKYVPQLHVMETGTGSEVSTPRGCSFIFEEAEFYAVTSYQNKIITHLKIHSNPFARGFRDVEKRKSNTSCSSPTESVQATPQTVTARPRKLSKTQKMSQHAMRSQEIIQQLAIEPPRKVPRQHESKSAESRGFVDLASTLEMIGATKHQKGNTLARQHAIATHRQTLKPNKFANLAAIVGSLSRVLDVKQRAQRDPSVVTFQQKKFTCEVGTQTSDSDTEDTSGTDPVCNASGRVPQVDQTNVLPASPHEQEIFLESVNLLRNSCDVSDQEPTGKTVSQFADHNSLNARNSVLKERSNNKDNLETSEEVERECLKRENKLSSCQEQDLSRDDASSHSSNKVCDKVEEQRIDSKVKDGVHCYSAPLGCVDESGTSSGIISATAQNGSDELTSNDVSRVMAQPITATGSPSAGCLPLQSEHQKGSPVNQSLHSMKKSPCLATKEAAIAMVTLAESPIPFNPAKVSTFPTKRNSSLASKNIPGEDDAKASKKAKLQQHTTEEFGHGGTELLIVRLQTPSDTVKKVEASSTDNTGNLYRTAETVGVFNNESSSDALIARQTEDVASCTGGLPGNPKESLGAPKGTFVEDQISPTELSPIIINTFSLQPGQKGMEDVVDHLRFQNKEELFVATPNVTEESPNVQHAACSGVLADFQERICNPDRELNTKIKLDTSEKMDMQKELPASTTGLLASNTALIVSSTSHIGNGAGSNCCDNGALPINKIMLANPNDASVQRQSCADAQAVSRVTALWPVYKRDSSPLHPQEDDFDPTVTVYSNSIVEPVCSVAVLNA